MLIIGGCNSPLIQSLSFNLEIMTPFKQTKRRLTNLKKHFTELYEDGYINDLCEDIFQDQVDSILNHLKDMEIQNKDYYNERLND